MGISQVSVAQAKAEFAALVARAEAGEDIIVTRNGRPVARLTHLEVVPVVYGDLADLKFPGNLGEMEIPADIADAFEGLT
jgi:prevent-host-death family protein